MALNPAGDTAYVAEWDIGRLSAVSLATGAITPLVSGLSGPFGVALSPAGNIAYVAESSSGRLTSVDLSTGNTLIVNGGLIGPLGAAVFPQPGCTP
jgi:DNA-binding beta-propeller fold protein YncE